jgi:hypothetical protein
MFRRSNRHAAHLGRRGELLFNAAHSPAKRWLTVGRVSLNRSLIFGDVSCLYFFYIGSALITPQLLGVCINEAAEASCMVGIDRLETAGNQMSKF